MDSLDELKKGLDIKIVNIVVSTSLDHDIPLEKMAATLSNTEYNPEQFPGLVIRIKEPKTSALIFSSGNVVSTGARSLEDVRLSLNKIKETLKKINIKIVIEPEINIQNMVASGNLHLTLNLNKLALVLPNAEYSPETFPGLIYKVPNSHITYLLFGTGRIVCTGAKNIEEIKTSIEKLRKDILKVIK